MKNLFSAFIGWLSEILQGLCNEVAEGFRQHDGLRVASNIILIVLYLLALLAGCMGIAWVIVAFKSQLILAAIVIAVIGNYAKKEPDIKNGGSGREPITAIQKRAEVRRKAMSEAAYVLFNDLRIYLPGLPAFTLQSVEANPPYIINPANTIIHHMKVMKGHCDVDVGTILELLETIIDNHIQAKDLPIAVTEEYTASTGEKAPGLVVNGVHDMGNYYRIDLVITDEAEAIVYAERHAPKVAGVDLTTQTVLDEDFG